MVAVYGFRVQGVEFREQSFQVPWKYSRQRKDTRLCKQGFLHVFPEKTLPEKPWLQALSRMESAGR